MYNPAKPYKPKRMRNHDTTDQSVLTTVIPYSTFINVHGSVSLICVRWNLLHKMRNVFDLIDVEGSCVVQVICGDAISVPLS